MDSPFAAECLSGAQVVALAQALDRGAPAGLPAPPRIRVVPFVAEQGEHGRTEGNAPTTAEEVVRAVREALGLSKDALGVWRHEAVKEPHYWGSCARSFCRTVAPHLPALSFIVSHGNFLRRQLGRASGTRAELRGVPNGGVLLLHLEGRVLVFVRHCLTCHNVDRVGSATSTMCHDFHALAPAAALARAALRSLGPSRVGVYCSPLPRAVTSAVYLLRPIAEGERRGLCSAFGACRAPIKEEDLRAYLERWKCGRSSALAPFCQAGAAEGPSVRALAKITAATQRESHAQSSAQ